MFNIEKLTTSLQFIGAALALPAGAAGVYSAYHTYFSPEVMCQEMRNTALATLEKNIPAEAKLVLLRKDVTPVRGEVRRGRARDQHDIPGRAARAGKADAAGRTAFAPASIAGEIRGGAAPRRNGRLGCAAEPAAAGGTGSEFQPGGRGRRPPLHRLGGGVLGRAVHGWVAIELRKGGKVTESFFSGYAANGQSLPRAGTVLTAMALRPIWSEPQGPGPSDPTKLQGRLKVGECVRVVDTRPGQGRQWAEVEPTLCQ